MVNRPYRLLVPNGFSEDIEPLRTLGPSYEPSLLKQLEKLQADPHSAGDRYDCDALPDEYSGHLRKCDIKGRRGPKVFYIIANEDRLVLPFFIVPAVRNNIDYRKLQVGDRASKIVELIEEWPAGAADCEVWIVHSGEKMSRNAAEVLEEYGAL